MSHRTERPPPSRTEKAGPRGTGAILEAVSFASERVFPGPWRAAIDEVLERLGRAAELSRVYLFENVRGQDGRPLQRLSHEWTAEGIPSLATFRYHRDPPEQPPPQEWVDALARGESIHAVVRDLPEPARSHFAEEGVRSIVATPVFAAGDFWGELGFDDCVQERRWSPEEVQALRAAAGILGARIHHEEEGAHLRNAEARYRTLVEQIPAVVYIDAVEGPATTLYISPQTESMLGFTQQDWMDDPDLLSKHVHLEDRQRWREEIDRSDATGRPLNSEYRIVARDGRVVWVHDEAVLVRDPEGRPQFWHGVMFDISEQRAAEQALREAFEREREAAARLRTLDDMKNTFLQAVSHELRTPLTSILGSALTLDRADLDVPPEDARDLLRGIASNARKLHRLLSDLLDLDRLGRGIIEPNRMPTDVAGLARRVLAEAGLRTHPVEVDVDAEPVMAWIDAAKVERIVENLLVNAARHTPDGTPIWLRVTAEADGVLLCVEDAGPGVPPDMRETIFEPFRQATENRPHAPGVGVGLALVARFAELHGGRAWVEERPGGGASFKVLLPGNVDAAWPERWASGG